MSLNTILGEEYVQTNCPLNDFINAVENATETVMQEVLRVMSIQDIADAFIYMRSSQTKKLYAAFSGEQFDTLHNHRRNYVPFEEVEAAQRKITNQIKLLESQRRSS